MDDAILVNRASKFEKVIWLQAVCYAVVVRITSIACLFLGSMLYMTDRRKMYVEATYVIIFGGCTMGPTEFIACFVHAEQMGEVNYFPKLRKTKATAFGAFVAAAVVAVVPTASGMVTHPYIERIVIVLVVVVGMLFWLLVIISLVGDISFRKCVLVINIGGMPKRVDIHIICQAQMG